MKLRQHHFLAISMILGGAKREAIAEKVGVDKATVGWWSRDADFQSELERQRDEMRKTVTQVVTHRLAEEAPRSLDKMVQLRDGARSEQVQLTAADRLLDKAGFKEVERVQVAVGLAVDPAFLASVRDLLSEMRQLPREFNGVSQLPERVS